MPRVWNAPNPDDLVRRYLSGVTASQLGREHGVAHNTVLRALEREGCLPRDNGVMPATQEMLNAYNTGESVLAMSQRLNISRGSLTKRLRVAGVDLRGVERNGHNSFAARARSALTSEMSRALDSPKEHVLLDALRQRGADPIPQRAVGPYNIDIAVLPVAVEVLGSDWHNTPTKRESLRKRTKYLLNHGWSVVYVVIRSRGVMSDKVPDKVISLIEIARRDPTTVGQYWVLGCNGKPSSAFSLSLDN